MERPVRKGRLGVRLPLLENFRRLKSRRRFCAMLMGRGMAQTDANRDAMEVDNCLLPSAVPLATRQGFALTWTKHEALPIREYVESQTRGETVSFLQRLTTERVYGQ